MFYRLAAIVSLVAMTIYADPTEARIQITRAQLQDSTLHIEGTAQPGSVVTIVVSSTDVAVARPQDNGRFSYSGRHFVPSCEVLLIQLEERERAPVEGCNKPRQDTETVVLRTLKITATFPSASSSADRCRVSQSLVKLPNDHFGAFIAVTRARMKATSSDQRIYFVNILKNRGNPTMPCVPSDRLIPEQGLSGPQERIFLPTTNKGNLEIPPYTGIHFLPGDEVRISWRQYNAGGLDGAEVDADLLINIRCLNAECVEAARRM